MNQDLDRIKSDVETMQMAMGLAPSMSREWIEWMKRDKWFSLWWCVPGIIVIAATLLPLDQSTKYLGLVMNQWAGVLVALTLLVLAIGHTRRVTARDGRPEGLVREARRANGMTAQGLRFGAASLIQIVLYFVWGNLYHIPFEPFWAGLFMLLGSTYLVAALTANAWLLLGYAIPFLMYGLCLPLAANHHAVKGVLFGMMFIAVALSFSFIQVVQIHNLQRQHESH